MDAPAKPRVINCMFIQSRAYRDDFEVLRAGFCCARGGGGIVCTLQFHQVASEGRLRVRVQHIKGPAGRPIVTTEEIDCFRRGKRIAHGSDATFEFHPAKSGQSLTHVDEIRQQRAGLSGAILVLEPTAAYDPATDITLLLSVPRNVADNAVILLNGTPTPAPLQLQAGKRYRLRVINIHTFRPSMRVELKQGAEFLSWRPLAKDGMDVPAERSTARRSAVQMGNGETYDFEFVPAAAGELRIEVLSAPGLLLATQPIVVR